MLHPKTNASNESANNQHYIVLCGRLQDGPKHENTDCYTDRVFSGNFLGHLALVECTYEEVASLIWPSELKGNFHQ